MPDSTRGPMMTTRSTPSIWPRLRTRRTWSELLMDEYGCSDIAELRALMLHENQALLDTVG